MRTPIARLAAATLEELKGIGAKTAAVIAQAAGGQTPDYLAALEEGADQPVTDGGAHFRVALRGDLHTTPTGPTVAVRLMRWRVPQGISTTSTSCSPITPRGSQSPTG